MINRQFSLHRGDTWPGFILTVSAADPGVDPIDFTDCVASSDIRETPNGALLVAADIATEATATEAVVTVSLTKAKTAILQGSVVSDVQILLADGRVFTPLRYQLNVTPDSARGGAGAITGPLYAGGLASGSGPCSPITATLTTVPIPVTTSGGGVTDHGALTGLSDDDHTQYLTNARGDARYQVLVGTELKLRTIEGDVVTITVVKVGAIYNLKVGQPT